MQQFKFLGRVLPEKLAFNSDFSSTMDWSMPDEAAPRIIIAPRISKGEIEVTCACDVLDHAIVGRAYTSSLMIVKTIVALHNFANGECFEAYLDHVQYRGEEPRLFWVSDESLSKHCTAFDTSDMEAVWQWALTDHGLMLLFNDVTLTLSAPQYAPIGCGRIVDGVRNQFRKKEKEDAGVSWKAMRDALNLTQPYLTLITKTAEKPRHAEPTAFERQQIQECLERTWKVLNRFVVYRNRGMAGPLPLEEFPTL